MYFCIIKKGVNMSYRVFFVEENPSEEEEMEKMRRERERESEGGQRGGEHSRGGRSQNE